MKKRYLVGGGIGLLALLLKLIEWFGESVFGTYYEQFIEPVIKSTVMFSISIKEFNFQNELSLPVTGIIIGVLFATLLVGSIGITIGKSKIKRGDVADEVLHHAIEKLKNDKDYILAAQVYKYSIVEGGDGDEKKKIITIEHKFTESKEGMDINAILHERFEIAESDYIEVEKFVRNMNNYEKSGLKEDLDKTEKEVQPLLDTLKRKMHYLETKLDDACVAFILYKGINAVLQKEKFDDRVAGISDEELGKLKFARRTGCLPTILLHTAYIFRNGTSSHKGERIYYSVVPDKTILPDGNKNTLVVLTLSYGHVQRRVTGSFMADLFDTVNDYIRGSVGKKQNGETRK